MDWKRLKDRQCPKCGSPLFERVVFVCDECNFVISKGRLFEIVGKPNNHEKEANKLLRKSLNNMYKESIDQESFFDTL